MDNNFNENTMNNIKNMVDSGNISEAISQISPEMIQNFSKMLSKNSNQSNNESTSQENFSNQSNSTSNDSSNLNNSDFNFNNIDINTLMKFSSVFNMNNKNDPRANLLNSLRPYLRDGKQNKLDNYINLLNVSKIADIMKANNNNKENSDA